MVRATTTGLESLKSMTQERLLNNIVKGEKNVFVFSGCGTSGRVAWLCARSYNRILCQFHPELQHCFRYCISGGDQSLVISNELPEDDPHQVRVDAGGGGERKWLFGTHTHVHTHT